MYGLSERDLKYMNEAFSKYGELEKVLIFGSRAMGNYKKASDVDLALIGDNINRKILLNLSQELNEVYPWPYFFDLLDYKTISNKNLCEHIDDYGQVIYISKK